MSTFKLKIVSPDGVFFDGEASQLSLRAIDGEIAIFKKHIPFLTAVDIGECRVYIEGEEGPRRAACCGGMLNVSDKDVLLAPTTFEWSKDIDKLRAQAALDRAREILSGTPTEAEKRIYTLKQKRAELRIAVAEKE